MTIFHHYNGFGQFVAPVQSQVRIRSNGVITRSSETSYLSRTERNRSSSLDKAEGKFDALFDQHMVYCPWICQPRSYKQNYKRLMK
ncbi:hypothetical protein QQF64_010022 [Cirrhinus molitorella]|uniref:Uncharacterized protein n=1 Tax=Cirrhinus molitorella TaxID=172907 RepID=A0ABR3M2T9_9TELE